MFPIITQWRGFQHLHFNFEIQRLHALPLITILILLTNSPDVWYLRTPLVLLCILSLTYNTLREIPATWFLAFAMLATTIYLNWESSDNHKYVIAYWCLTLCCVFTVAESRREQTLEIASRLLIGLAMFWATLWKAMTPEYMNGTFFEYTLLADDRFAPFTELWGGISSTTLADNRELRSLLVHGYERGLEIVQTTLQSNSRVSFMAQVLTWWTVLIEGWLAAIFFIPDSKNVARLRNASLLLFAITTYSVATVRGFGWMLMLLGLAQCSERDKAWRAWYLAIFLLIQIFTLPTSEVLALLWK
jgi:hypothetical protein